MLDCNVYTYKDLWATDAWKETDYNTILSAFKTGGFSL